jgi:hypothetical protein
LRPISKTPIQKRAGGVTQGVGPEFKFQEQKKEGEEDFSKKKKMINKNKILVILT